MGSLRESSNWYRMHKCRYWWCMLKNRCQHQEPPHQLQCSLILRALTAMIDRSNEKKTLQEDETIMRNEKWAVIFNLQTETHSITPLLKALNTVNVNNPFIVLQLRQFLDIHMVAKKYKSHCYTVQHGQTNRIFLFFKHLLSGCPGKKGR